MIPNFYDEFTNEIMDIMLNKMNRMLAVLKKITDR